MYLGKELGRNIMALTRSNIEGRFPELNTTGSEGDGEFVLEMAGGRSSFDYDSEEFGTNPFPREWADPEEEEFSDVSEDPSVDITVLDDEEEEALDLEGGGDGAEAEAAGSEEPESNEGTGEERDRTNIFNLGNSYRIQVGTFTVRENAESVWESLTTAGFNASVSTFTDEDEVRYRVTVGSFGTRQEADDVAEQLRSMNFDAWVYEED